MISICILALLLGFTITTAISTPHSHRQDSTLTHDDITHLNTRLDSVEATQQHAEWLLRCIEEAQQEAERIIAASRKLETEQCYTNENK